MGGPVGQALDPTGGKFLGLNKVPVVGNTLSNVAGDVATGGLAAFGQRNPFALPGWRGFDNPLGQGNIGTMLGIGGEQNPYVSGPFALDPNQVAGDVSGINMMGQQQAGDITSLGQQQNQAANALLGQQYGQSQGLLGGQFGGANQLIGSQFGQANALTQQQYDTANQLAKQQYGQTLNQIPTDVQNLIQQENPGIMENLNASGLLTNSAYPQEIARQQSYLTQNLAIPAEQQLQQQQQAAQTGLFGGQTAAQQGEFGGQQAALSSLYGGQQNALAALLSGQTGAQQGLFGSQQAGLQAGQGFQTGGLQRQLSLEDQINNANISKQIGQIFAPQAPTGKQNFGTAASGIGALSPWFAQGGALGKAGKAPPLAPKT